MPNNLDPIIQFSHANGFPAQTYEQLFAELRSSCELRYIPQLAHTAEYPVTDNWPHLVDELIADLRKASRPVIGVGHSLGGVITLRAALREPALFSGVILLDPPLLNPLRAAFFYILKCLGLHSYVTFESQARRRRAHWPDAESLRSYLESKPLFRRFQPQALQDYIRYGTVSDDQGLQLAFDPAIEARIYATLPHTFWHFQQPLQVPGVLLYARDSNVVNWFDRWVLKGTTGLEVQCVPGTHLFPFEYPQETALTIKHIIRKIYRGYKG